MSVYTVGFHRELSSYLCFTVLFSSQVPDLSCRAPLVRVEAPSSYFQAKGARLSEGPPCLGETFMLERDAGRERELHILGSRIMSWHGLVGNTKECVSPWGSLGEIPRVVLQWSGRNPMAPVIGCLWWCPICITRGIHHKCKHPLNPTRLYVSG
ncbi:hypothetical protein DEO72_LG9g1853 [Vigna unguiculata]|uniref:Uncharacterized protein n=1 Tax=Vigna unguiculata TaxID=3917 RepID=A0A4D6N2U4_VIGUN|nr:hypothetical protein DEO72_LG9g1853 [Vigna unguiculata]